MAHSPWVLNVIVPRGGCRIIAGTTGSSMEWGRVKKNTRQVVHHKQFNNVKNRSHYNLLVASVKITLHAATLWSRLYPQYLDMATGVMFKYIIQMHMSSEHTGENL